MEESPDVTLLLKDWVAGDGEALERLAPLVYEQLKRSARKAFRGEPGDQTLQPTALVNEVFINLVEVEVPWQNRAHFYALCARMMRRLLINHAHERNAQKRGGGQQRVEYIEGQLDGDSADMQSVDMIALDAAMDALAQMDKRKAELVELQYFAGLTFKEMQETTGLSSSTLDRELRFSRAWLKTRLAEH